MLCPSIFIKRVFSVTLSPATKPPLSQNLSQQRKVSDCFKKIYWIYLVLWPHISINCDNGFKPHRGN